MFDHILGNDWVKDYLKRALKQGVLAQTLLFTGPDGVGKALFAKELAKTLLGSEHSADLHILSPEGKSGLYSIDTIREMITKEHESSFEGRGKVFILEEADRMQPASANALLKTLEEPTEETTFILLSSHPQEMLPTILSRCVHLSFQPLKEEDVARLLQGKGHPPQLAKLAHGSMALALEIANDPGADEIRKILFFLLSEKPSYPDLSLQIDQIESLIEKDKEEDPVRVGRRVELFFAQVLMWHRDQHVRQIKSRPDLLFFPDAPVGEPLMLKEVEKRIEKAHLAYQRNIKLSVCLKSLFS